MNKILQSIKRLVGVFSSSYFESVESSVWWQDPDTFERDYTALITRDAPPAPTVARAAIGTAAVTNEDEDGGFKPVGKGGRTMLLTAEGIFKSLQAVQEARGKKVGTSPYALEGGYY